MYGGEAGGSTNERKKWWQEVSCDEESQAGYSSERSDDVSDSAMKLGSSEPLSHLLLPGRRPAVAQSEGQKDQGGHKSKLSSYT